MNLDLLQQKKQLPPNQSQKYTFLFNLLQDPKVLRTLILLMKCLTQDQVLSISDLILFFEIANKQ